MPCAECGGGGGYNSNYPQKQVINAPVPIDPNCPYTQGILVIWKNALKCIKNNNQCGLIGISEFECNIHAGNIQSAINYPENYCYFNDLLTNFQQNILPRIIENVPSCI